MPLMTIHKIWLISFCQIALVSFAAIATAALADSTPVLPPRATVTSTDKIGSQSALRGYGRIDATFRKINALGQSFDVWQFDTSSAINARTVAGKFLADITLSPGCVRGNLQAGGHELSLVTVEGGISYTGFALGSTAIVVSGPSAANLKSYIDSIPAIHEANLTTSLPYPAYLDRFDRYGWGFYGFRADWNTNKRPGETDPVADLDWCAKYNFRFELWPKQTEFDDSYSVPETHDMDWIIAEAEKRGVPLSARLYGGLPHVKEYTDAFEQPLPFIEGGWYWPTLHYRGIPHQSWFNKLGRLYVARQAQEEIRYYKDHPEIGSWMMPYGEMSYYDWYATQGDRSPAAIANWRSMLKDKCKVNLREASAMYNRPSCPFRTWNDVTVPEIATFAGLPGLIKDLEGDWSVRPETTQDEGIKGEWWNGDVANWPWDHMHMPGSVYWWHYAKMTKWALRDFDISAAELAKGKTIYLYSYARANNGIPRSYMPIYLNGRKIGDVRTWGAWDVTSILKPGHNRIALQTDLFGGRVFLSTEPPAVYPYLGAERNRLWRIFNEWLLDSKYDSTSSVLAAMREVEPNKPIKIMAPTGIGSDRWLDLAKRFGAWGHFTGEGVWAFMWYKRYGYLYGVPGTSEGGGPSNNVDDQVNLYQRVFLEGLNGHDQVFTVQDITGKSNLKDWFEKHIAVLKQLGRFDIAGPQVLLFRSENVANTQMPAPDTSATAKKREIQSYWNWDIGRGTLQSIGQSALYLDDTGLAQARNAGYPIMIDCGNEILASDTVKNLEKWVRGGGTYVTLPFTGRSLPDKPDSWPIKDLTGCRIGAMRTPGAGKGTVTVEKNQTFLTELAGKTFPDAGSSMDWQDFEHNNLSVELKPESDSQVIARYENGAPAIVVRKLGAGRVIVLGAAFFRGSHDIMGLWWPTELESTFFRDLLTNLGQPSVNSAGDYRVFTQRYRANNGLDDVVVVDNFAGEDRTFNLRVVVDRKPSRVYRVAMNSITDVTFTMQGKTVIVSDVAIPKGEVQVYYLRRPSDVSSAHHWLAYQQKMWKPTDQVKVDMKPLDAAGWTDPTVDLKPGWRWTQQAPVGPTWQQAGFNDGSWKHWNLDIFNAVGADSAHPVYARKLFSVPHEWLHDGGVTKLTAAGWSWPFALGDGSWTITLNDTLLQKDGYFDPNVASLLKDGLNVLTLELGPPRTSAFIGVSGSLYLTHCMAPIRTIDLSGQWTSVHESPAVTLQFPGKGAAFAPERAFNVPANWKGKYIVTCHAVGSRESTVGVIVNEMSMTRRHHHLFGNELEQDITPFLKYGAKNTIALLPGAGDSFPVSVHWDISSVELRLYPVRIKSLAASF